jgi:hypothetical protein
MTRILVNADGTETAFNIDRDSALAYAEATAKEFGVGDDHNDVMFSPELAKAALKN